MLLLDKDGRSLYEQLFESLRQEIIKGELKANDALKPIRVLAEEQKISNNTVSRAYQQLLAEGYIRSVKGSGYYVEKLAALPKTEIMVNNPKPASVRTNFIPLKYDFSYDNYLTDYFPWTKWGKYMQSALLEESCSYKIGYERNEGNVELRKSLCQYINNSRGVNCDWNQIVICAGTQYAMDIITNLLCEEEHEVGVEDPSFVGMQQIFINKGYTITSLPMTDQCINLDELNKSKCKLLYITPSHQFPTGIITSLEARKKILDWVQNNNAIVIENDYDNEFLFGEKPLPSIQSLSNGQNVIYLSTLSKVLSPSLRCAYFVLPYELLEVYEEKYKYYYSALPTYNQTALANFIKDGHLEKHVRKMSLLNKRKYNIFYNIMEEQLAGIVQISPAPAGSHVLVRIPACSDQESLILRMRMKGIGIYGVKQYWRNHENAPENVFLFGFNSLYEEEIEGACFEFARSLKEFLEKKEI
jgi:GntR family transcriptional regulator / MocR family aminotransferase